MNNKDLQRLLSTFPDDLEVFEVQATRLQPVTGAKQRKGPSRPPYLVLDTTPAELLPKAPRATESDEQEEDTLLSSRSPKWPLGAI